MVLRLVVLEVTTSVACFKAKFATAVQILDDPFEGSDQAAPFVVPGPLWLHHLQNNSYTNIKL